MTTAERQAKLLEALKLVRDAHSSIHAAKVLMAELVNIFPPVSLDIEEPMDEQLIEWSGIFNDLSDTEKITNKTTLKITDAISKE